MTHMRTKMLIAGLALLGAVGYLAFAGARKGWVYYVDVDTFLTDATFAGKDGQPYRGRVRLCGRVAEEDLDIRRADLATDFNLLGPTKQVRVIYRGAIPDAFVAGADVVIEGAMTPPEGTGGPAVFKADVLITKCASKYQAEEHAKRLEAAP